MIAYYVHDSKKETDLVVLPDMGCSVTMDAGRMEAFISVNPDFANWSGDACGKLSPEDFGTIVASRDEDGDVCVVNHDLWRRRMAHYLGAPSWESPFYKHMTRSKIEFLKGVKSLLDARIEYLEKKNSKKAGARMTKVKVE